jgi:hypothetical protein
MTAAVGFFAGCGVGSQVGVHAWAIAKIFMPIADWVLPGAGAGCGAAGAIAGVAYVAYKNHQTDKEIVFNAKAK